jgi:hypothetical protein
MGVATETNGSTSDVCHYHYLYYGHHFSRSTDGAFVDELGLNPAREIPTSKVKVKGKSVGAGDAWHHSAAPVDGAPASGALGPGDTARIAVRSSNCGSTMTCPAVSTTPTSRS